MQPHELASRRVKLNDLRILMTVVQVGSMNKAATLLHSTQPAISRSIKDLERTIGAHSLVVVCGSAHWMARRRKIALPQLAAEPWVLPPPDLVLGAAILEGFRKRGVEPPAATVMTVSPEARMSLVSSGRFLTIFPQSALKFSAKRAGMVILPVKLPLARVPVGVVTLKNRMMSPVARLFIEHAREVAKPLAKHPR